MVMELSVNCLTQDEMDRLDLTHCMERKTIGGELFLAPISENVQRIMDVGTGTGICECLIPPRRT